MIELTAHKTMMTGLVILALLAACARGTPTPNYTPTATNTPPTTATYTPSPTITSTATPLTPLEGRLFFDMNGSGLRDETTFNYDPERLADPRQPLQPDLAKMVNDYVSAHPDIKDGDLISIEEPGLSDYTVCVKSDCVQTDAQGNFSLPNPNGASRTSIKITDPYAEFPAWAMRYINDWKGPVVVPAYTKDVDAATMATLTLIPGCDIDLAALVCKLNETTLQVRDQHLNDTSIIPIVNGTSIKLGADNNVGLMQGFLTLPFVSEQVLNPFIWNYFDIIGYRLFDDQVFLDSTRDDIRLNYNGMYNYEASVQDLYRLKNLEPIAGVSDSHTGLDYLVPVGNFIVSSAPTSRVWYIPGNQDNLMINIDGEEYDNCYGHLNVVLVEMDQTVYRGQIVGISGNFGEPWDIPQLHFHVGKAIEGGGWYYLDEYRYILKLDPLPKNFWGNPVSLWTADNLPQFLQIDSANK